MHSSHVHFKDALVPSFFSPRGELFAVGAPNQLPSDRGDFFGSLAVLNHEHSTTTKTLMQRMLFNAVWVFPTLFARSVRKSAELGEASLRLEIGMLFFWGFFWHAISPFQETTVGKKWLQGLCLRLDR